MRDNELDLAPNKKFFAIYRAKVVSISDPMSGGRVQVRVFGIHSQDVQEVPNDTLPWAYPATVSMGDTDTGGFFVLPAVESIVWVFFDGGNHNFPVYFASAPNKDNWNTDADEDNAIMDLGERALKIVNDAGAEVTVNVDGTVSIQAVNLEINVDGDIDINAGGNITEIAGKIHRTQAGRIEHN